MEYGFRFCMLVGFFPLFSSCCFFDLSICLIPQRPFNLNVNMPAYEYTGPAVLQPCCFLLSPLKCVKIWYASGNIFHSSLRHLHMTTGWQTDDWQLAELQTARRRLAPGEAKWSRTANSWGRVNLCVYSNDPFLYHLSFYARIWPHTSFIGYLSWLPRLKPARRIERRTERQTDRRTDGRMQEFIKN